METALNSVDPGQTNRKLPCVNVSCFLSFVVISDDIQAAGRNSFFFSLAGKFRHRFQCLFSLILIA